MSDKFIEEITLNTTPFINQTLHLNKINFIFGLNGSGKQRFQGLLLVVQRPKFTF